MRRSICLLVVRNEVISSVLQRGLRFQRSVYSQRQRLQN
nr:MAG TPA: hypothetical protein [Caudoviricetes sp.]